MSLSRPEDTTLDNTDFIGNLVGAQTIVDWFGHWPSFHDAEVVSLELHRTGTSYLKVHAFRATQEVDARSYYKTEQHAVITFALQGISFLCLSDFSVQNVISGLVVRKLDETYSLELYPCYGLSGEIRAKTLVVSLRAGISTESVYHPERIP